jgi:hypothetical protein
VQVYLASASKGVDVAPGRSGVDMKRNGEPIRQSPLRSALAAVPPQARQGAGAAGKDRVQGDPAPMSTPTFIAFAQKIGVMPKAGTSP